MHEFIEILEQLQRELEPGGGGVPHRRIALYEAHLEWLLPRADATLRARAESAWEEVRARPAGPATLAALRAIAGRLARHDAVARERERTVMGEHVDALLLQAQRLQEAEEIEQVVGRAIERLDAEPVGELDRMHAASDLLETAIAAALGA